MISSDGVLGIRISTIIHGWVDKIQEINKKYEKPRIRMSRGVRIALIFLRLYLILLVLLLGYKFWTLLK